MILHIYCLLMLMFSAVLCSPGGARQSMMRLARADKSLQQRDLPSGNVLLVARTLDPIGGGNLLGANSYTDHSLGSLDKEGQVLKMLNAVREEDLLSSLDSSEGAALVNALKKTHTKHPKRMLDSVSGWAFGESKRNFDEIDNVGFTGLDKKSSGPYFRVYSLAKKNSGRSANPKRMLDSVSGWTFGESKRNFDEIDNVGFTGFAKKSPNYGGHSLSLAKKNSGRSANPKRRLDSVSGWTFGESKRNFDEIDNVGFTGFAKKSPNYGGHSLALAKKNFDEIDRAGFETYNKRNFDEIDRTGFETFEKRDRKE